MKLNKTVVVANRKGGTGKTTTTLNLGWALSLLGYSVLLVDLDSQANLSRGLGARRVRTHPNRRNSAGIHPESCFGCTKAGLRFYPD